MSWAVHCLVEQVAKPVSQAEEKCEGEENDSESKFIHTVVTIMLKNVV